MDEILGNIKYQPHLSKTDNIFEFTTDTLVFSEIELPLGWHEHTEIIRILEGEGEFVISGKTYRVRAGSFVIINPFQIHSGHSYIGRPLKYQSLKFIYTYFDNYTEDPTFTKFISPLIKGEAFLPSTIINSFPIHSFVTDLFNDISDNLSEKVFGHELYTKTLMYNLIYIFYKNRFVYTKSTTSKKKNTSEEIVKSTINYIHDRYDEVFDLDLLSTTLETSKPHLCRIFKRMTSQTITEYQNNYRIKKACESLIDTNDSINKIAFDLGYSNISYFHSRFKQKTQMTPNEYRTIYKKE